MPWVRSGPEKPTAHKTCRGYVGGMRYTAILKML
jgi:hypothetical protein